MFNTNNLKTTTHQSGRQFYDKCGYVCRMYLWYPNYCYYSNEVIHFYFSYMWYTYLCSMLKVSHNWLTLLEMYNIVCRTFVNIVYIQFCKCSYQITPPTLFGPNIFLSFLQIHVCSFKLYKWISLISDFVQDIHNLWRPICMFIHLFVKNANILQRNDVHSQIAPYQLLWCPFK